MGRPRILLVTHSLASGGTERVAVYLANGLSDTFEVVLLNIGSPEDRTGLTAMLESSVDRVVLDRRGGSRAAEMAASLPALRRAVRALRPDLVLATGNNNSLFALAGHLANPNPRGRFAVKLTNPIVRARDNRFRRTFRSALYRRVFERCARVLVLSEGERREVASLYPALAPRLVTVANPYVTPAMLAVGDARAARSDAAQARNFIALGRLHPQKNYPLMLRAWRRAGLADKRLLIAGDGGLRAQLEREAEALGIAGSVEFLGYRPDVPALLAESRCLLLSSDYEGLPAVALEAFAAGLPVVTTESFPAARELIGGAPGSVVVPLRDEEALAAAIRRVSTEAMPDPGSLQARTRPYTIEAAVQSHAEALSAALAED